jgi:hypothetical protein
MTFVYLLFSGMNNREVIEQVERGYRMAQPSTITYPESKTLPSEVKIAQANVYKVSIFLRYFVALQCTSFLIRITCRQSAP